MRRFRALARPDGTDLRTGTVRLLPGATVRAPVGAPFRLARSAIELVVLGAIDDDAVHAPWRVFDVDALTYDYDEDFAMTHGHASFLGDEVQVLEETPLAAALGFDPASWVDALQVALERCTPHGAPILDDDRLATLVAEFLAIAATNEVRPSLRELAGLPVRCTSTQPAGPWWRSAACAEVLLHESALTRQDADNLAACDGTGAVRRYIERAASICERFDAWAAPHHEAWPRTRDDQPVVASVSPGTIVEAHLLWKLVEPLLDAPPRPLRNLFEPLTELAIGGAFLVGWTATACVLYRPQ